MRKTRNAASCRKAGGCCAGGRQLAPAMPWLNYSNLSEADAMAIAVYLKTLKPVKHAVPKPLPPGTAARGPVLAFPAPSAWDAPR